MKVSEGDWIIDKTYGEIGTVCRVFPDGVSARFGGMTCIRKTENFKLAPLDIRAEDIKSMLALAKSLRDFNWVEEIRERMIKEGVK